MPLDDLRDETMFTVPVRDPVWKHIWLTPALLDVTRTEPFLRLYRIRQLGPAEYVYPGASHTRAGHSIGVYHIAQRLLRVLLARGADAWVSETGCWSFLAAALLHDAGHFPFTHALKELPLEDHESLTAHLILAEPLRSAVAAAGADPEMTARIIDKNSPTGDAPDDDETRFFRNLLSGVLDPDKLDYLNRDAYYCGVPYGVQDTDFILSRIKPDREHGIGIDSRAIMSIESVLFAKYLMYRSVYWHRRVRVATAMMKKTLWAGLSRGLVEPETLYGLDDAGLYALVESLDFPEKEAAVSIRRRRFYRCLAEFPFNDDDAAMRELERLERRSAAEAVLAEALSCAAGFRIAPERVLIDIPERISFESDLPVHDEGCAFSRSSTVFSGALVGRFTSSLRIMRVVLHPEAADRIPSGTATPEKLAKWLGVRYTDTQAEQNSGESYERA